MKKTLNKIYIILGVMAMVLLANSCLKDDRYVDFSKVPTIIELLDASPGNANVIPFPVPFEPAHPDTAYVRINATGAFSLNHNVSVTIDLDPAALAAFDTLNAHFNVENDSAIQAGGVAELPIYNMLPDSLYSITSKTVVLPAGKRANKIPILIFSTKFDLSQLYVLPVKITNASGETISGNIGSMLMFVSIKNIYDDNYHAVGTRYNYSAAADFTGWNVAGNKPLDNAYVSTGPWDFVTHVSTVNANTVAIHVANSDGGFGTMDVTINPDNSVTIASSANTGVANLIPLPGVPSSYDPVAHSFELHYQYTNASGTFRVMTEKLVIE